MIEEDAVVTLVRWHVILDEKIFSASSIHMIRTHGQAPIRFLIERHRLIDQKLAPTVLRLT